MEAFSKNQKESFLQHLENPELVTDVPEWCYKKYDVKKNEDEENRSRINDHIDPLIDGNRMCKENKRRIRFRIKQ